MTLCTGCLIDCRSMVGTDERCAPIVRSSAANSLCTVGRLVRLVPRFSFLFAPFCLFALGSFSAGHQICHRALSLSFGVCSLWLWGAPLEHTKATVLKHSCSRLYDLSVPWAVAVLQAELMSGAILKGVGKFVEISVGHQI